MSCPISICPSFVLECIHAESWVIWLYTSNSARQELDNRGILGTKCPRCGNKSENWPPTMYIVTGPGVIEEPKCLCYNGLTVYNLARYPHYITGNRYTAQLKMGDRMVGLPPYAIIDGRESKV